MSTRMSTPEEDILTAIFAHATVLQHYTASLLTLLSEGTVNPTMMQKLSQKVHARSTEVARLVAMLGEEGSDIVMNEAGASINLDRSAV
ncbi:MAG: hypothetical protein ACRD1H_00545 [Vicinamibacterales bacterium]